jgi:hypothetical protein
MPQTQTDPLVGEQLLERISQHVLLVMLRVRWPKMSYQIADAIVEVAVNGDSNNKKEIAEEFRTKPQWQLMPEDWRLRLVNLEGRARSAVSRASIQFAARGVSVLPIARASEVFTALRALRAEMDECRTAFRAEYAGMLTRLQEQLDADLYNKVSAKLPEESEVASKFGIEWAIIPAGGRSAITDTELDILAAALDAEDNNPAAVRAREVLQNLRARGGAATTTVEDATAAELIQEARTQMREFTHDMITEMAEAPRRALKAAVDNLLEALRTPSRLVRQGTLRQVEQAFEMLEGFQFIASHDLVQQMRTCRVRLRGITPQQLNSNAEIGAQLAAALTQVQAEAGNTQASQIAVRNFRRIRIRDPKPAET